ncbi:M48 family metalloprotease [Poritiphilus flavus]|uniref:IrrE N-terminal-like domain-containing protein n=1 Tax=Poritiphilus flavus TaxID=2697053 RepID=A0A6L9EBW8_9FLAO|nr:hypothetical protein [Poritiphilus flavus]NAS12236.1 hypothetical protein [Poritiphilus flavus]
MKYLPLILIAIVLVACKTGENSSQNDNGKKNDDLAFALIKSRQGKYRKKAPNKELDINADELLKQIFCPNGECNAQAIKDMENIKNAITHPKTKHELFVERYSLAIDLMEVERVINEYDSFEIGEVYPYTVDCKCYNAMALSLLKWGKNGDYLLEINNGLSLDIGELAKVSSRILPYTDNDKIAYMDVVPLRDFIATQKPTIEDFGVKVMGHLLSDPTPDSTSLSIDPRKIKFYSSFFRAMKFFVIAHEYSHALLQHDASYSNLTFKPNFSDNEETIEIANYPNKEHEADSLAFTFLLKHAKTKAIDDSEIFIAGAELWFMWLDIFQKSEQLVHGYYNGQESHPSANARRKYIQDTFENKIPKTTSYSNLIDTLDKLFEILWSFTSEKFEPAKNYIKELSNESECFDK